jgi:hypothetical protein
MAKPFWNRWSESSATPIRLWPTDSETARAPLDQNARRAKRNQVPGINR